MLCMSARSKSAVLKVHYDEFAENPRTWDNLGTMVCWHRRYNLGDKQSYNPEDFAVDLASDLDPEKVERLIDRYHILSWESALTYEDVVINPCFEIIDKHVILLSLYFYDHSGITISTSPFSCSWDSGQVGWIYVTKDQIRKEYSVKRISKKLLKRVAELLAAETEEYDKYLTGQVFGFVLEDTSGAHLDSCWGFLGDNFVTNGMVDHLPAGHRHLIDDLSYVN